MSSRSWWRRRRRRRRRRHGACCRDVRASRGSVDDLVRRRRRRCRTSRGRQRVGVGNAFIDGCFRRVFIRSGISIPPSGGDAGGESMPAGRGGSARGATLPGCALLPTRLSRSGSYAGCAVAAAPPRSSAGRSGRGPVRAATRSGCALLPSLLSRLSSSPPSTLAAPPAPPPAPPDRRADTSPRGWLRPTVRSGRPFTRLPSLVRLSARAPRRSLAPAPAGGDGGGDAAWPEMSLAAARARRAAPRLAARGVAVAVGHGHRAARRRQATAAATPVCKPEMSPRARVRGTVRGRALLPRRLSRSGLSTSRSASSAPPPAAAARKASPPRGLFRRVRARRPRLDHVAFAGPAVRRRRVVQASSGSSSGGAGGARRSCRRPRPSLSVGGAGRRPAATPAPRARPLPRPPRRPALARLEALGGVHAVDLVELAAVGEDARVEAHRVLDAPHHVAPLDHLRHAVPVRLQPDDRRDDRVREDGVGDHDDQRRASSAGRSAPR